MSLTILYHYLLVARVVGASLLATIVREVSFRSSTTSGRANATRRGCRVLCAMPTTSPTVETVKTMDALESLQELVSLNEEFLVQLDRTRHGAAFICTCEYINLETGVCQMHVIGRPRFAERIECRANEFIVSGVLFVPGDPASVRALRAVPPTPGSGPPPSLALAPSPTLCV